MGMADHVQVPMSTGCYCHACNDAELANQAKSTAVWTITSMRFIVCSQCGNKRCPKATDHRLDCTGSNEAGQPGSCYEKWTPKPYAGS